MTSECSTHTYHPIVSPQGKENIDRAKCKGQGTLKNMKIDAKNIKIGNTMHGLMNAWLNWCVQVRKFDYSTGCIVY